MTDLRQVTKFSVQGISSDASTWDKLRGVLLARPGVSRVDFNLEKKVVRVVSDAPLDLASLPSALGMPGLKFAMASPVMEPVQAATTDKSMKINVSGMTCQSCEITVERKFKQVDGVTGVNVNASRGVAEIRYRGSKPDLGQLQSLIEDDGYQVLAPGVPSAEKKSVNQAGRPSLLQLIVIFSIVIFVGYLFSRFGLLRPKVALDGASSLAAVFLIGLVAASSSCIAVAGGVMLSSIARFNQARAGLSAGSRLLPTALFISGRLVSYGVLGGLIGLLGSALTPSPVITGLITLVAAMYMLVMGLDMLNLAPTWLKSLTPKMPKAISHRFLSLEDKAKGSIPFFLGGATFFLPCGFTQALQLYALTTGSFARSAAMLFVFALGTAPALAVLGLASSSLKGAWGQYFYRFSGALVIVLGLWNIQNGFSVAGYPLSLAWVPPLFSSSAADTVSAADPNVMYDGQSQVVKISVGPDGYTPNSIKLRQNVPTRLEIDGKGSNGCLSVFQVPRFKIRQLLNPDGVNSIEFTPTELGPVSFSCGMGMYRGEIKVVPNNG